MNRKNDHLMVEKYIVMLYEMPLYAFMKCTFGADMFVFYAFYV